MEYYAAMKKNAILPGATPRMDPESIMLSEPSQTQKDKYCMIPAMWEPKAKPEKQTHRRRDSVTSCQRWQVGERGQGLVKRHKLQV